MCRYAWPCPSPIVCAGMTIVSPLDLKMAPRHPRIFPIGLSIGSVNVCECFEWTPVWCARILGIFLLLLLLSSLRETIGAAWQGTPWYGMACHSTKGKSLILYVLLGIRCASVLKLQIHSLCSSPAKALSLVRLLAVLIFDKTNYIYENLYFIKPQ